MLLISSFYAIFYRHIYSEISKSGENMVSIYSQPIKAKIMLKFTMPTIFMMVFMSLYTVVDGIVVANCVGSKALSAINIVYPFTLIFMALSLMFSTGSNALIAKKMGEGKQGEANSLMSTTVIVSTVFSILIAVVFTLFSEPLYMAFGSDESILPYCIEYGNIMIPYGFVITWQILNQSYLVTAGKPHVMLIFSILSGITNIVLDILFMAVLKWGIVGAGLGTIIGMAVGAVPLVIFFNKKQALHFGKPVFNIKEILFSMANGSSEAISNLATAVTTALFNMQMMHFAGQKGVAAISAVLYIHFIFTAVSFGFTSGISPVISFHFGAENRDKLSALFKLCIKTIIIISAAMFIISEVFSYPLVRIFSAGDTQFEDIALNGFRIFALNYLICGINIFASGLFTALNNGKISAVISITRTFIIVVSAMLILPLFMGIDGVWAALPAAEATALILSVAFIFKNAQRYSLFGRIKKSKT